MSSYIQHILVAIGSLKLPPTYELRKAAAVARASGASVELFHAIEEPDPAVSYPQTATQEAVDRRRAEILTKSHARLELFARKVLAGIKTTCTAAWDHPPHDAVVRRALAIRADVVVAASRPHRFGARLLLRNIDWELIRQCPVPLLLVKSSRAYDHPVVLAAVDPFHAHARPADLDSRLLGAATHFAQLLDGTAHAFHAYRPMISVEAAAVGAVPLMVLPPEAEEGHGQEIAQVIQRLAKSEGIPETRCHIKTGDVVTQLTAAARRTHAGLVVMGAVSRSSLTRLFIGNAAERALDHLGCDVLVVKPHGFTPEVARTSSADSAHRSMRAGTRAQVARRPRTPVAPVGMPPLF